MPTQIYYESLHLPPADAGKGTTVYVEGVGIIPTGSPWPEQCPSLPGQDTTPPEVTFVSPVPGNTIGLEDPLVVNVTDNLDALERALLVVYIHSTGVQELAYDGDAFTARYVAQSTRVAITDGFQFTLQRTGGWPNNTSVTVRVFAVDSEGNVES